MCPVYISKIRGRMSLGKWIVSGSSLLVESKLFLSGKDVILMEFMLGTRSWRDSLEKKISKNPLKFKQEILFFIHECIKIYQTDNSILLSGVLKSRMATSVGFQEALRKGCWRSMVYFLAVDYMYPVASRSNSKGWKCDLLHEKCRPSLHLKKFSVFCV